MNRMFFLRQLQSFTELRHDQRICHTEDNCFLQLAVKVELHKKTYYRLLRSVQLALFINCLDFRFIAFQNAALCRNLCCRYFACDGHSLAVTKVS